MYKQRVMIVAVAAFLVLLAGRLVVGQGQVPQENKSDQRVTGFYDVVADWPKPLSQLPNHKGWTWGAVQGVFAQNPNRIFVAMRGELPDVTGIKTKSVEVETEDGRTVRLPVPGRGMYVRNASVGLYSSPGEATDQLDRKSV